MNSKCPICGRAVAAGAVSPRTGGAGPLPEDFPFCSRRCRLADLGLWFNGHYRIPGSPVDNIEDGGRPTQAGDRGTAGDRAGEAVEGT
jgi:endogenous inhibitor of DNA gyrase (YacG/DUF329 family)